MTLKLYSLLDKQSYTFSVNDENDSRIYCHFRLTLSPNMPDGLYRYTLEDENKIISQGLAQIGDYTPNNTVYTGNTSNGYIQYNG